MLQIEKVIPDGTKRFGILSDSSPGVVLLIRPLADHMFKINITTVDRMLENRSVVSLAELELAITPEYCCVSYEFCLWRFRKMRIGNIILWEIPLLLASVLFFRSSEQFDATYEDESETADFFPGLR